MVKYKLTKTVYDPIGNKEYNCYVAKEIELTEKDVKQILTENLPSDSKVLKKIRKVLDNE